MKNWYRGINPHLNSELQSLGGAWESFHGLVITALLTLLDRILPDDYYAINATPAIPILSSPTPTLTLPIATTLMDEDEAQGITIYRLQDRRLPDIPVTRIEVLSPANKHGGSHHRHYLRNRRHTLLSGLCLVELDWLHESRPLFEDIPSYPDRAQGAYPYHIIISDPHPTVLEGAMAIYGFGVADPVPTLPIPLADQEYVLVDFNAVYQEAVTNRRVFAVLTDYEHEPIRFHTYHPNDQAYIREQMRRIASGQDVS